MYYFQTIFRLECHFFVKDLSSRHGVVTTCAHLPLCTLQLRKYTNINILMRNLKSTNAVQDNSLTLENEIDSWLMTSLKCLLQTHSFFAKYDLSSFEGLRTHQPRIHTDKSLSFLQNYSMKWTTVIFSWIVICQIKFN